MAHNRGLFPSRRNVRFGSKADMCSALGDVRFVPIADMGGISQQIASACPISHRSALRALGNTLFPDGRLAFLM